MSSCTTSGLSIGAAVVAAVLIVSSCTSNQPVQTATEANTPAHTPRASSPEIDAIDDGSVHDLPGLHNVLVQAAGPSGVVLSGALPEGEGFATLASLGVRTVISVDAAPVDLDTARANGLRYVQIPVEYAGISTEEATQLAVALRDVEGPVYIHCHHGKHRGPAAAALALVEIGALTNEEGVARLKAAGTSPNYPGLYRCVEQARAYSPEALAALSAPLPERAQVSSMAGGMAVIDRGFERLELVKINGWQVPADHPDLSPVAIAATVETSLRSLSQMPSGGMTPPIEDRAEREAFVEMMRESAEHASALESAIAGTDWIGANTAWDALKNSCNACHKVYRNADANYGVGGGIGGEIDGD